MTKKPEPKLPGMPQQNAAFYTLATLHPHAAANLNPTLFAKFARKNQRLTRAAITKILKQTHTGENQ